MKRKLNKIGGIGRIGSGKARKQAIKDIRESITQREPNETYCFIGRQYVVLLLSEYPEQIIPINC